MIQTDAIYNKALPLEEHMPNHIIIALFVLVFCCSCKPKGLGRYNNDDLGIAVEIPPGWRHLTAEEAGQDDAYPKLDLLRIGTFGKNGDIDAMVLLANFGSIDDPVVMKQYKDYMEIGTSEEWKGQKCYIDHSKSSLGTIGIAYIFIRRKNLLVLVFAHPDGNEHLIKAMMERVHFEPDPTLGEPAL